MERARVYQTLTEAPHLPFTHGGFVGFVPDRSRFMRYDACRDDGVGTDAGGATPRSSGVCPIMEESNQTEHFSLAYIRAVAAHASYQVSERPPSDKDSIDGDLISREGRQPQIAFQAKATSRDVLRGDRLVFPLSLKSSNDLRLDTWTPRLLMLLPTREEEWLVHSEDELRLRHCGYWLSLPGIPATANTSTVSVSIPRAQVCDTVQLRALMGHPDRGIRCEHHEGSHHR